MGKTLLYMFKSKIFKNKNIGIFLGASFSVFFIGFVVLAWTGPTEAPPGGNIPYPINAVDSAQYKVGALGIGGVFQTDTETHLSTGSGSVGIGTENPGGLLGLKDANTYIDVDASSNLTFTDAITGTKTLAQVAGTDFVCGSTFSYGGQDYGTVRIGDQCWMSENLNYDNGCTAGTWTDGTYTSCAYNTTATADEYGLLYQWQAAVDACPDGWHLPSDDEWKILEGQLGMSVSDVDVAGWRYSGNVGAKLKGGDGGSEAWDIICANSANWYNGMNQSHLCYQTGFEALPGRYINTSGTSNAVGPLTLFWSSSIGTSTTAWFRHLAHDHSGVRRVTDDRADGFSVRCLRD
jgi:uncharacterized protein (TIGR02145 family)